MELRRLDLKKGLLSIFVTLLGIAIDDNPLKEKALFPILVTLLGKIALINSQQLENA